MPSTPNSARASLTSSSLNGLMMASIFFMRNGDGCVAAGALVIDGCAHSATAMPPSPNCRLTESNLGMHVKIVRKCRHGCFGSLYLSSQLGDFHRVIHWTPASPP